VSLKSLPRCEFLNQLQKQNKFYLYKKITVNNILYYKLREVEQSCVDETSLFYNNLFYFILQNRQTLYTYTYIWVRYDVIIIQSS